MRQEPGNLRCQCSPSQCSAIGASAPLTFFRLTNAPLTFLSMDNMYISYFPYPEYT